MMNTVNEHNQLDDEIQNFMPQQIEQDYLSCLLGADDINAEKTGIETEVEKTESELSVTDPLLAEQVTSKHTVQKETLNDCYDDIVNDGNEAVPDILLEKNIADTSEILHETLSGASENEEVNTGNEPSVDNKLAEQYMSVAQLSVSAPFVCQLMLIAGVKFAVPLANFSRVITLPENVKVNSNGASACVGKFEWQDKTMFLLALKRIMQPANTAQDEALKTSDKIVVIEKDNFGFVCNQLLETVTISPEKVLWRDESSQRYWLAGMVKDAGFAVLDVKGILSSAIDSRQ